MIAKRLVRLRSIVITEGDNILNQLDRASTRQYRLLWIGLLTVASVVLSGVYACATPFAALAASAALDGNRRDGLLLIAVIWFANQVVGFGFLGYPLELQAYVWGIVILASAVAAFLLAREFVATLPRMSTFAIAPGAFLIAFAGDQMMLYGATFILPSSENGFSLAVVSYVATVNLIAFVALVACHWIASAAGIIRSDTIGARSSVMG